MINVTLTPAELAQINQLAAGRNLPKRRAGVKDRAIDRAAGSLAIDRTGLIGEYAVASALGIPIHSDTALHGDGGVTDLVYRGYTIQVKTTRWLDGRMLFKRDEPMRADLAVLVIVVTDWNARIVGWIDRSRFEAKYVWRDLGYGPTQCVDQCHLVPLASLIGV